MDKENQEAAKLGRDKAEEGEALMWIGNQGNQDLRANFERFKKQKVEQIKYRKYVTE